eukprot:1151075-Pelagomonas_calceolata.AAC.1
MPPVSISTSQCPQHAISSALCACRKGEEVTISYGSMWPDAAFLLLFGFLPEAEDRHAAIWLASR